jgi:hypothetical protein
MEGADPTVAAPLYGLDEDGIVGGISEGVAQAHDGAADALLKIDEDVGGPKGLTELLAGDHHPGTCQQEREHTERKILETNLDPVPAEFTGAQISFEYTEANRSRRRLIRTPKNRIGTHKRRWVPGGV